MHKFVVVMSVLGSVTGCGGGGKKTVEPSVDPLASLPTTPDNQDCVAMLEDAKAGSRDRFSFQDADLNTGYKDGTGAVVIPPRYAFGYEFGPGGIAAVVERPTADGQRPRFLFIDPSGTELAEARPYDNGPDYFQEGLARIVDSGHVGFIDRAGAIRIAPQFVDASSFCHGVATVHDGTDEWEIDRTGAAIAAKRTHVDEPDPCGD